MVLFACRPVGLHAVSLRGKQLPALEFAAIGDDVFGVAFDAPTDTLLVLVRSARAATTAGEREVWQLASLRRNLSDWQEVQRLSVPIAVTDIDSHGQPHIVVCSSHVLLGGGNGGGHRLFVFDVNAEHTLRAVGTVAASNSFVRHSCTRLGNDTYVAFSYGRSVSVYRLASLPLRLEPLVNVDLTAAYGLLFREDLLLVADWNSATQSHAVMALRPLKSGLTQQRVLLDVHAGVHVWSWTLAGDRLVLWDFKSKDLLVYAFE